MPRRAIAGAGPSSYEKQKYKYKPYHKKANHSNSKFNPRRQNTSSSNPDTPTKRYHPPARSSSERSNHRSSPAETRPPAPPRLKHQKSFLPSGIFGIQRGDVSLNLVRRLGENTSKGKVPEWLSNTCSDLPSKHPLRTNAASSVRSPELTQDEDHNPFAFQPPSPPPECPVNQGNVMTVSYPHIHAPRPRAPLRRMKLSSMTPHAFPMFTKPTYQENYHDVAVPLNDFDMVPSPPCLADDAELSSPDLDRNFDPPPHMQYSVPSPMTSSPLFISDVHVTSPHLPELSPAQSAFLFSSDDATLPTPPHTSSYFPEQDEIHNVLHNQYSFISSVYAISPTPGSLPLEALIGNSSASSRAQASSPLLGPTWSNSPRISAHTSTLIQPRSGSADVYKARLLAYATAAADQLSSTGGDEVSTYQRWGGEQLAVDDTHEHLDNFETYNEMVPKALNGDTLQDLSLEDTSKGPSQSQDLEFSPVNQLSNEPHTLAPIAEVSSETNEEDLPNSKNLNQIDTELFEDWQDEPEEDDFDDRTLDPEHDFTLAEQDELAADEEAGKVPISLPQGSAPFIQDKQEPIAIANQKRNLPIPPFPVSSSRQAESEHKDPSTSSEVMTKLSPKFAVRSARCVRPSPFAHLLKKRREPAPNVEGTEGQDPEDEIEVWPA